MTRRQFYSAPLCLCALMFSVTFALAHDEGPPHEHPGASMKADPAAAFAILVKNVLSSKDAVEVELPHFPGLFQFLTVPPSGRYVVKQLTLMKDDEVRALSVALHPPHDMFLARGKDAGNNGFEGIYYVIDRTGWLKGAAAREGKTIKEVPLGDVWQGYETEKSFWLWLAEQMAAPSKAGR